MPLYEYRCESCDTTFEKFVRSFSSTDEIRCPECESKEVSKAFSAFATGNTSRQTATAAANCAPSGGG